MKIYGVCDRFEDEIAVIILDKGGEMLIPKKDLPKNLKEGDVVSVIIEIDKDETRKRMSSMNKLREKLLKKKGEEK